MFSGDLKQYIDLTTHDYNACARQHQLSVRQKSDFFVKALSGSARTFFLRNARDNMSFTEMPRVMIGEYNSDAGHLQM